MTEQRPPRVFISYSHDTVEHQERVLSLADRLRADGLDAEVDQYNAAPPEGWPLWCEQQIAAADVVLMVCTETYHRRVTGDEERGKGLGVVWEARLIRQLLYDAGVVSDKFVPVLFSDDLPEQIPTPIRGWTQYVVDTEEGYEDLYRRLTRQPRLLRPALGTIRPLPPRRRQWPEARLEAARAEATAPASLSVFISYCHEDQCWLDELKPHLQILEKELGVPFWDDTKMPPGVEWLDLIKKAVDSSVIFICLLSANYFSSQFIQDVELDLIHEANTRGAPLFPIYARPFSLHPDHWLSQLQGVNSPEQTLAAMDEVKRQTLYSRIADMLRVALTEKLRTLTQFPKLPIQEASPMPEPTEAQEGQANESARYNIAVVGRTGVGKSELINYLFGKQVAESGVGKPVTKRGFTRQDFEVQGIPGTLFDSWGLEIDNSNEWIADLQDEMRMRGTDRPAEDWFHTIFFCIDACSSRIQHFETSIIKQFLNRKYRVIVVLTKSDLASKKNIDILRTVIGKEVGTTVPIIPVCSISEELAVGRTMPFGANDVFVQIYEGFWLSIIQRLPNRCITLMCSEIEKWRQGMVDHVENEMGVFNQKETVDYVNSNAQMFFKNMHDKRIAEIIGYEARDTIAAFHRFERVLDYSVVNRHDIEMIEMRTKFPIMQDLVDKNVAMRTFFLAERVKKAVMEGLFRPDWKFGAVGVVVNVVMVVFQALAEVFPFTTSLGTLVGAGVIYVTIRNAKSRLKLKIMAEISEFADRAKRELIASEPQVEASLRNMFYGG